MKDKLGGKIKAILFDLDGTLLDVDLDKFFPQYLNLLAQSVAHIIPPKKFISKILMALKAVEENNGKHTNDDVYTEVCFPLEGYSRIEIQPFIDKFYEQDFIKLREYTKKKHEARNNFFPNFASNNLKFDLKFEPFSKVIFPSFL